MIDPNTDVEPLATVRRTVTEDEIMYMRTTSGTGAKQNWPAERISFGFDPSGGWGRRMALKLHWGAPGGWIHEAKWWLRPGNGIGTPNVLHDPVGIPLDGVAERYVGLGWELVPPARADELEIVLSAPGGVHIFAVYER